jgi:uncharacterized protein YggE
MPRLLISSLMVVLVIIGGSLSPARAAQTPAPPSISVDADGKVMATPDLARLTLEVETQAKTAATAARENAQQADRLLAAVKKVLAPQDQVRTLGYRLVPVRSARSKTFPPEIRAYRAVHRLEVKVMDVARLAKVIDTSLQNGASQVRGPFWGHANLDELQRQAAVHALKRARAMAEALAQAAGLKIKGVERISTGIRFIAPRAAGEAYLMAKAAPPTPIEVGQEEIRAHVQAVFLVSP